MIQRDLIEAFSDINDTYILEADPYQKKIRKTYSIRQAALPLSFAMVLLLVFSISIQMQPKSAIVPASGKEEYESSIKAENGFEKLPDSIAGKRLKNVYSEGNTWIAEYIDEAGNVVLEVSKTLLEENTIPFELIELSSEFIYWTDEEYIYTLKDPGMDISEEEIQKIIYEIK